MKSPRPHLTVERFEEWLQQTVHEDAPDMQESILQQFAKDRAQQAAESSQPTSSRNLFANWLQPLLGLAAAAVLGIGCFMLLNDSHPHTQSPQYAASDNSAIIEELLLLEDAESVSWLLNEENLITLTSYLPR